MRADVIAGYCPEHGTVAVWVRQRSTSPYTCTACQRRGFSDYDSYRAVLRELRPRLALWVLAARGWAVPDGIERCRILAISRVRGEVEILVELSDGRRRSFSLRYAPPLPGLDVDLDEVPW